MKKDATDRALRLTKRNALISTIFYELTNHEGFGFVQAYVLSENMKPEELLNIFNSYECEDEVKRMEYDMTHHMEC